MKTIKTIIITITFLILFSCNNNSISEANNVTSGSISVNLPIVTESRSWSNADVNTIATAYEIIVYNATETINSGILTTGGLHNIVVPVGTYDILVLAGKFGGHTTSFFLLGLGESELVTVEDSKMTPVSVTINTFNLTTNWPTTSIDAGSNFTVTCTITYPVSSISINAGNFNLDSTTYDITWNKSGNAQTGTATLTAPASSGTYGIILDGLLQSYTFRLVDTDYAIDKPLSSVCSGSWHIYHDYAPDNQKFTDEFKTNITTVLPSNTSGIAVDVTWGS